MENIWIIIIGMFIIAIPIIRGIKHRARIKKLILYVRRLKDHQEFWRQQQLANFNNIGLGVKIEYFPDHIEIHDSHNANVINLILDEENQIKEETKLPFRIITNTGRCKTYVATIKNGKVTEMARTFQHKGRTRDSWAEKKLIRLGLSGLEIVM